MTEKVCDILGYNKFGQHDFLIGILKQKKGVQ
jgi:hypothetical protein